MQTFAFAKTFATYDNAVAKLRKVLGDDFDTRAVWHIGASRDGRFYPVVTSVLDDDGQRMPIGHLAHHGVCVAG